MGVVRIDDVACDESAEEIGIHAAGEIDFACLQPGHYDAGMKGAVNVAAVKGAPMKADSHGDHKH